MKQGAATIPNSAWAKRTLEKEKKNRWEQSSLATRMRQRVKDLGWAD